MKYVMFASYPEAAGWASRFAIATQSKHPLLSKRQAAKKRREDGFSEPLQPPSPASSDSVATGGSGTEAPIKAGASDLLRCSGPWSSLPSQKQKCKASEEKHSSGKCAEQNVTVEEKIPCPLLSKSNFL